MEFAKTILSNVWPEWEIVDNIGAGSYGKVYKIKREYIGDREQFAALKVIRIPSKPEDADFVFNADNNSTKEYYKSLVTNIVKEIELMSKVKGQTNIVSYEDHKVIEDEDGLGWTILLRMELLTPFSEYIKTNEIGNKEVTRLGIDICKALEVCKKYSIVHRDIKTENVFVSETGDFKLGDFGTARTFDKTVDMATMAGTYPYMAPEVIKQEPHGHQSDIYSLGIMLYKLLNKNRFPFYPPHPEEITHDSVQESFRKRLSGEKLPVPCDADKKLSNIIFKACEYNRKDRFANATEMRKALEEKTDSGPIPFPWEKILRVAACLGAIALIITGIFFGVKHIPNTQSKDVTVAGAFVANGEEGCLKFTEYENSIEITGLLDSTCDVIIPKRINGKPVTAIANSAFYYCYIENIELPDTIETIGTRAFYGVSGLKDFIIPFSVKVIEEYAFYDCTNLKTISIPSTVESIGDYAFCDIENLEKIVVDISNENYSSTDGILYNKNKTELISYPIAKKETEFVVPSEVKIISKGAFSKAAYLSKISLSSTVESIDDYSFDGCTELSEIVLPEGLKTIGRRAFAECSSLSQIIIPDSVEEIGIAAFYNSESLENITVGKGVKKISNSSFTGTPWFSNQKGFVIIGDGVLIGYNGTETSLEIPDNVKAIESLAFYFSTTSFGSPIIEEIFIPDSVTKLGADMFVLCTPPKTLHIPANVAEIEDGALEPNAYYDSLSEITLDPNNPNFTVDEKGVIFNKDKTKLLYCPKTLTDETYIIPATVKEIGAFSFESCENFAEIIIPNGVVEIGESAFSGCHNLIKIDLPETLVNIGKEAFYSCSKLEKIELPINLKNISEGALSHCNSIKELVIPSSIEKIEVGAFEYCNSLISINVDHSNQYYKSIDGVLYSQDGRILVCYPSGRPDSSFVIPDSVSQIGEEAFCGCNISSVTLSANMRIISQYAFNFCEKLSTINLSDVSIIGSGAFSGCTELKNVSFSSETTIISDSAFRNCEKLSDIILPVSLTYIDDNAFANCNSMKLMSIPSRVRYIGYRAFASTAVDFVSLPDNTRIETNTFYGCKNFISFSVTDNNTIYSAINGVLFSKDGTKMVYYPDGKKDEEYTLLEQVVFVSKDALANAQSLKTIYVKNKDCIIESDTIKVIHIN